MMRAKRKFHTFPRLSVEEEGGCDIICTLGCLRKNQLLKVSMWKVAFCIILVLEVHKKILGLDLSGKAEKVNSLFSAII